MKILVVFGLYWLILMGGFVKIRKKELIIIKGRLNIILLDIVFRWCWLFILVVMGLSMLFSFMINVEFFI